MKKVRKLSQWKKFKGVKSISKLYYSDEWSENLETICLFIQQVIDIRFESIKLELDNLVDKKIMADMYLYEQIYRNIRKGQKLHKIFKVNWNLSFSHLNFCFFNI